MIKALLFFLFIITFLQTEANSTVINTQEALKSNVLIQSGLLTGSGFFISKSLVVTNYHVIESSKHSSGVVMMKKHNGQKDMGVVVSVDKKNDLALIKSFSKNETYLKTGNSSKLKVTDDVIIIGSPKGLQGTVSKGHISAKRKNFEDFSEVIQTTAPISKGSSGSPCFA